MTFQASFFEFIPGCVHLLFDNRSVPRQFQQHAWSQNMENINSSACFSPHRVLIGLYAGNAEQIQSSRSKLDGHRWGIGGLCGGEACASVYQDR